MVRIIDLANPAVPPESYLPPADMCRAGNPLQTVWNHYTDSAGLFSCGIWQGEDCTLQVQYGPHEEEFCVLLEGEVIVTAQDGQTQHFRPGAAFVVPGGFCGTWQNLGRVKKYYAIMLIRDPDQAHV